MAYYGDFTYGGTVTPDGPDYVYYNATIINNRTDDLNFALQPTPDPPIRFNESRDAPIIKDASKYHFSIVRFTMNGANRDLPLFIPNIQTGQTNQNLTTYAAALTLQGSWVTNIGVVTFNISPAATFMAWQPETINATLAPLPPPPVAQQDLSTRYYWGYTYQHVVDLTNQTFLTAHEALRQAFAAAWVAAGIADPFPYPSLATFQALVQTPQMIFAEETRPLFSILADSTGFGQPLEPFVAIPYAPGVPQPNSRPLLRLFFNTNLQGLYANFTNLLRNSTTIPAYVVPGTGVGLSSFILPAFPAPVPDGYTYEILFPNKFYSNVVDYRVAPYAGVPPLGYVPAAAQRPYWITTQDYKSVDSLWSPIESIVFTSGLLPIRAELTGAPIVLGTSNEGDSSATTQNAFQPIITDITLDTTASGSDDYRQFISYIPSAEYRMTEFGTSKQEIRNIDIQVYWKNRLDNELYPVTMYNLSSVSLKCMFRRKEIFDKSERA